MKYKDGGIESEHHKKMIAPVVISILLGAYYIAIGVICLCISIIPIAVKLGLWIYKDRRFGFCVNRKNKRDKERRRR